MINRIFLVILMLFFGQAQAFAEGASMGARDKSLFLIYADPIAFSPFYGQGINAGFVLSGRLVIEGAVYSGKSCLGAECQFETSLVEARAKWFLGNSFFVNLGVGSSKDQWDHSVAWGHADEANADFKATGETTGAVGTIGHMWHHGGFTIGCDWFGIYEPMSVSNFVFTSGEGYNEASRVDNEADARRQLKSTRQIFTRLHFGALF